MGIQAPSGHAPLRMVRGAGLLQPHEDNARTPPDSGGAEPQGLPPHLSRAPARRVDRRTCARHHRCGAFPAGPDPCPREPPFRPPQPQARRGVSACGDCSNVAFAAMPTPQERASRPAATPAKYVYEYYLCGARMAPLAGAAAHRCANDRLRAVGVAGRRGGTHLVLLCHELRNTIVRQ